MVSGPVRLGLAYRYQALAIVGLGVFLATMESSVVNIALPVLSIEFDAAPGSVFWVPLAYIITSAGLMLTMGRLGDLYGRKRIYAGGFLVFTVGTGLAAISGTLPELVGARVVQALGAAMVMSSGTAIVTASFPGRSRGWALGIQGALVGAGLAMGPVLGGVLVDVLDWRAIFWTRLPLSLGGSLLALALLRDAAPEGRPRGLDIPGAVVLFGLLFSLVLAVNRGDDWGWSSAAVVALLTLSGALLPLFVFVERRSPSPVVALELFRIRRFAGGTAAAVLSFNGFAAITILIPFYLIQANGFSTLKAGAVVATLPLTMLMLAPLMGALSDRIGPRLLTTLGLLTNVGGLLFMTTLTTDSPVSAIVLRLLVLGVGTGMFGTPNNSSVMGSVPADRLGTASAALSTARTVGQAIGIAIAGAIFTAQAAAYAGARSPLGLDDVALRPAAFLSGAELAFLVAAGIVFTGAIVTWLGGGVAAPPMTRRPGPAATDPVAAESAARAGGPAGGSAG